MPNAEQSSIYIMNQQGDVYWVWGPYPSIGSARARLTVGDQIIQWENGRPGTIDRKSIEVLINLGSVMIVK